MSDVVFIAGGGTGGHVFPGIAVAEALRARARVDVVFLGTPRGLETRIVPDHGFALELLDVAPLKGGGPSRAVKGSVIAAVAMARALRLVRSKKPRAVLSVGGYAAGPVSLAAAMSRVPVALLEPNSTLGLTNKLLFPVVKRAYVAWDATGKAFGKRARTLGVPLRAGFVPRPYVASDSARILVMGGSQGAAALNERLPAAIARVFRSIEGVEVVHQAGRDRDEAVRAAYAREGLSRVRVTPFLDDVAGEIAKADVVLARSGANTVAEICAIGRASVLVPFPFAAGDHQAKNALALEGVGGAVALRQGSADVARIAHELVAILGDSARRVKMANAARAHGRPEAADFIARDLLALAGIPEVRAHQNGARPHTEVP